MKAGLVRCEPGAKLPHATERAHCDPTVGLAAPRATPVLEPEKLLRSLVHKGLHGGLVAQPVPARNGVVGMLFEAVARSDDPCRPAFCRDGMAAHWVDLRDDRDV